jgi:carboxyl-terminal processing protease
MLHKGKLAVFFCTLVIALYGISAAFYGKVVARDEAYKELSVFMDVLKKINTEYVETPDMAKVQEGAMRGLMDALDPYSSFLSKESMQEMEKRKAAGNAGVGLVISKRGDVVYVISVQHDGPADAVGLRPGDYLMTVDGVSTEDKNLVEVESLLRGAANSSVKVTVFRSARTKPVEFELSIKPDAPTPLNTQILAGGVGLLDVSSLAAGTVEQARIKLKTLISAGAQKLILDLRDCSDGEIADGAELANFFLRSGLVAYTQNREGARLREFKADPEKFITDLPVVILINGSTAGAAEVAAGALKDRNRAKVVGEKSFGLGSIQKQIQLKAGATLVLTTAKYYTPGGKLIQDETARNAGIKPDFQSPDDDRRQDLLVDAYFDDQQDDNAKYRQLLKKIEKDQLDKAIEILSKESATEKRAA